MHIDLNNKSNNNLEYKRRNLKNWYAHWSSTINMKMRNG